MKRIICCILIVLSLCSISMLTGCDNQVLNVSAQKGTKETVDIDENFKGRFIHICTDEVHFNDNYYDPTFRFFYDKYTKVVYYTMTTSDAYGPEPLYNADGTFVVYEE